MRDGESVRNAALIAEIDGMNQQSGVLNATHTDADGNTVEADGIECTKCKNRGYLYTLQGERIAIRPCECVKKRASVRRLKASGLSIETVRRCTFAHFIVTEPWQEDMCNLAKQYASEGAKDGRWFYLGGQVGCGKTHIATATARQLIISGYDVLYASWTEAAQRLKALVTDDEGYDRAIRPYQTTDVLLIDDFFKPYKRDSTPTVTSGDVHIAYDIINARYIGGKPTIFSSEWHLKQIEAIDPATGSRIHEMCRGYIANIKRDDNRNYRHKAREEVNP